MKKKTKHRNSIWYVKPQKQEPNTTQDSQLQLIQAAINPQTVGNDMALVMARIVQDFQSIVFKQQKTIDKLLKEKHKTKGHGEPKCAHK